MIMASVNFPKRVTLILLDIHVVFLLVLICHYNAINIPLVHSQAKNKNKMMNSHCRDVAVVSRCLLIERWSYQGNAHFCQKGKGKILITRAVAWSQTVNYDLPDRS